LISSCSISATVYDLNFSRTANFNMYDKFPEFQLAGAISSSVPGSVGFNIAPSIIILVYILLIIVPFLITSLGHINRGFGIALAKYVTRNSWRLLFYHSGLTVLVVIYLFLLANENLHLERRLGYYTSSSTESNQVCICSSYIYS
jgi:hypothetical protein